MKEKLVLGTANFGLNYGIANGRQLGNKTIRSILSIAHDQAIWGLDTAEAYGDAEKRIGRYFEQNGKVFKVITKLPEENYHSSEDVETEISETLRRLQITSIDYCLIHSFNTYRKYGHLLVPVLSRLRAEKVIGRYGVSIYYPEEMKQIAAEATEEMAIEFPVNLFDHRFIGGDHLQRLKEEGFTLFGRSVFLQGLFFLEDDSLNAHFMKVREKIKKLREISEETQLSRESLSLLFVLTNPLIDGVIIGVDSPAQLIRNIESISEPHVRAYRTIAPLLQSFDVTDEKILLPCNWPG